MKILLLATRPARPSFRYRVEQAVPYFEQRGHTCKIDFLSGHAWRRVLLYRRLSGYDVIFLQSCLLSRSELDLIRQRARWLVYDLDNAAMYNRQGRADDRRITSFQAMAQAADLIVCGNTHLAQQTSRLNQRVEIIPTSIDVSQFRSEAGLDAAQGHPQLVGTTLPTVGWSGSIRTNRYLNSVFPLLSRLAGRIRVKIISDSTRNLDFHRLNQVPYAFVRRTIEREAAEMSTFDVGLLPLPDDPQTQGECGLQALQYMALGITAVGSRVGVNQQIIQHAKNGFLADSPQAWYRILSRLAADPQLRTEIGTAAVQRVEQSYSLAVHAPRIVNAVEQLAAVARQSA